MTDDRALVCKYGKMERLFRIADVSNGDFEEVSRTAKVVGPTDVRADVPLGRI